MSNTITMMKKDAVVNIQVGSGFLHRVQQVLTKLIADQNNEELEEFKSLMAEGKYEFPEDWMNHIFTLSSFVSHIESEALKQGHTYEQSIEEDVNIKDN